MVTRWCVVVCAVLVSFSVSAKSRRSVSQLANVLKQRVSPQSLALLIEEMGVSSFSYDIRDEPQIFLDTEYGKDTVIAMREFGSVTGFSAIDPDQRRDFIFAEEREADVEGDFSLLTKFRDFIFTPRHYVFWGEKRVYFVGRETLALEYVTQLRTQIDGKLALDNEILGVERVNGELLAVRYRLAKKKEFVQFVSLVSLQTVLEVEIEGEVLAIFPTKERPKQGTKMVWGGDDIFLIYGKELLKVNATSGKVEHRKQFDFEIRGLQIIDEDYLMLFSEQWAKVLRRADGERVLELEADDRQRIERFVFTERYASYLLEDRLHLVNYSLDLVRVPIKRLLALIATVPFLQDVARSENFEIGKKQTNFANFILQTVDRYVGENEERKQAFVEALSLLETVRVVEDEKLELFPNLAKIVTEKK